MTANAAAPVLPARRRRPFGVLVICGLLLFQAVTLSLGAWAVAETGAGGGQAVIVQLKAFGLNATFLTAADAMRYGLALLVGLIALTLLQAVLVFMLRRSGWVLTMLVVGVNLALQLLAVLQGIDPASLSLLVLSLTALYLNQAEVRAAFGIGTGRGVAPAAHVADAGDEPA